jgi:hypothetical protein
MTNSKEFRAWRSMKNRCYRQENHNWDNYGARGIEVCDRWLESFENFLEDMGKCPHPSLSLKVTTNRETVHGEHQSNK